MLRRGHLGLGPFHISTLRVPCNCRSCAHGRLALQAVNLGLHYSDAVASKTEEFIRDLNLVAEHMGG